MASHVPCRSCGRSTDGVNVCTISSDCARDVERRFKASERDGADHLAPITGATEARLRRLVDNWYNGPTGQLGPVSGLGCHVKSG
jgi:hypothetical protein